MLNAYKIDLADSACKFCEIRSFDDSFIKREFYRAKDDTVKARPMKFYIDDIEQNKPIEKIEELLEEPYRGE